MDPEIWANLPCELVYKIIANADLPIDTRLAFNIKPKKIPEALAWRLWYLLNNDGLFYILDTKSLHNFRVPGSHIVRRPVDVSYLDYDLAIFNLYEKTHTLEITTRNGKYLCNPNCKESFATERLVVLKGSPTLAIPLVVPV